jgi:hypothetical protein
MADLFWTLVISLETLGAIRMRASGWEEIYRGIGIRPYVAIGFSNKRETIRW